MLGKILIVDQIATNRIALRAKLGAAQFDVMQADTVAAALSQVRSQSPDLILAATHFVDGTAQDLLCALDNPEFQVRPPMMVLCSENDRRSRLSYLRAGIEDVVNLPIDDALLLARVRMLVRAATSDAEWRLRDDTSRALGFAEAPPVFETSQNVAVMGHDTSALHAMSALLKPYLKNVQLRIGAPDQVLVTKETSADAYVLDMGSPRELPEMLRLMSTLRCHRTSRNAAILILQAGNDPDVAAHALDMGANDLVTRDAPLDEIALRLEALLKRKVQADALRDNVRTGLEAAVCDPLTGLHNRRYAMPHLDRLLARAKSSGRPLAVMLADMDFFKQINDRHGHAAGDAVLVETAKRLRENLRAMDLVARVGGEEFLIVMPGATLANARSAANRICDVVHKTHYTLPNGNGLINASVSIGLAVADFANPGADCPRSLSPEDLLERADAALYVAKETGRNRVNLARPAA